MAILLTGLGYIGAALLQQVLAHGQHPRIVVLDNFSSTAPEAVAHVLPESVRLLEGDVADAAVVARAFDAAQAVRAEREEPLLVYHLAAQPSAAVALREPELTERSNLTGARVVLESARERHGCVVFGGSFRVYGDELVGQTVDEAHAYGRVGDLSHLSKVYVEQLARMLGVPFVSVRLGVTYGLGPIMKTGPAFMTVPNLFCQRAAAGEALRVLEDRPMAFVHVADAAAALQAAATRLERAQAANEGQRHLAAPAVPVWEVVNAASEVATIGQVGRLVQRLAQARGRWVQLLGAASAEASFEVRSALGDAWRPRHTLADSLGEVLDYFATLPGLT